MSEKRFDSIDEYFNHIVETGLFDEFQKEAKGVIEKMKEDGRLDEFEKESCDCSSEGFLDLEIDGEQPKEGFFEKLAGVFRKNDSV